MFFSLADFFQNVKKYPSGRAFWKTNGFFALYLLKKYCGGVAQVVRAAES